MPCRSLDTGFIEAYRMYAAASAAGWIYLASKEKPRLPLKYIVRQDGASTVCHHALPAPTSIPPLPTRNYKPIVPAASAPSQAHKWSVRAPTNLDYQFSTGNHKRFWDLSFLRAKLNEYIHQAAEKTSTRERPREASEKREAS